LIGLSDNEPIRNVFFYRRVGGGVDVGQAILNFTTTMLPKIADVTTASVTYTGMQGYNLGDPLDFAELGFTEVGNVAADPLPMFAALNFTYKLNTRAVRPGSKRFCGIPESVTVHNVVTDATHLAAIELLRLEQEQNLRASGVDNWKPVVVKRVKYAPDPLRPTDFAYRLPETEGELVLGDVVVVLFNPRLSHQVSRGNGRG